MEWINNPICAVLQEGNTKLPIVSILAAGKKISADVFAASAPILLIADDASLSAARPCLPIEGIDNVHQLIFPAPAKPKIDREIKQALEQVETLQASSIIVIGSGSLSDIGKYVAAQKGLPLTIIATAPSMNGYTSMGASLIKDRLKQSFPAKMVGHLIIAEDIINASPARMQQAGLSDALSSISADIDWQLSNLLLDTPYLPEVFEAQLPNFKAAQHDSMELLKLLVLQGFAMSAAGSSAPASGGEHMLAHASELLDNKLSNLLHGELIALTHPVYLNYQRKILASESPPKLRSIPSIGDVQNIFEDSWETVEPYYHKKSEMINQQRANIEEALNSHWLTIQTQLQEKMDSFDKSVSQLTAGDHHVDIIEVIAKIMPAAFVTRDRFTMLDLEAN